MAFEEIARRHGDYALCGVAALVESRRRGGRRRRAGYLSVCDVPTVVDLTGARAAHGRRAGDAGDIALAALDPADDIHATAAYRAQLVRVLTARVLRRRTTHARSRRRGAP